MSVCNHIDVSITAAMESSLYELLLACRREGRSVIALTYWLQAQGSRLRTSFTSSQKGRSFRNCIDVLISAAREDIGPYSHWLIDFGRERRYWSVIALTYRLRARETYRQAVWVVSYRPVCKKGRNGLCTSLRVPWISVILLIVLSN